MARLTQRTTAMSFVGAPYTHDIFISYNHGDVRGEGDANFMTWSRCFFNALRRELLSEIEFEDINIFFDQSRFKGQGVDAFVPLAELETKARSSAILMPLVSPRYLLSEWCTNERTWWLDQQRQDGNVTRGRLMPIWIWGRPPPGMGSWRDAVEDLPLADILGIHLYDQAGTETEWRPFGWPGQVEPVEDQRFFKALAKISSAVALHLPEFKQHLATRAFSARAVPAARTRIYLHGLGDARKHFDMTFKALSDKGFEVEPDSPERFEPDNKKRNKLREQRVKVMGACDALFIVAPEDDMALDRELEVVGRHERGLAIAHAEKNLRRPGKLPFAVVDPVRDARKAARRKHDLNEVNVEWFGLAARDWIEKAAKWLKRAA
jgi:hypothetical protein